jgi:L-alanine-DL-glutamate epimerase-like enolase superfamily enzyme
MRITDVSAELFRWDGLPAARYGSANMDTGGVSDLALVSIETDGGITGHAFLGASFRPARLDVRGVVDVLKPALVGKDALERGARFADCYRMKRAVTMRCIGAIDVALWDISAKAASMPLHRMLGTVRQSVPAYASSSTLANHDAYLTQFDAVRARGFRAYKLHPPRELEATIRLCRDIRRAAGPDYVLMIDPAMAFRLPDAMRLGRVLEELGFYWYEDPLGEEDMHNYVALRQKLDIPILATEYAAGGFETFGRWLASGATDYIRGDIAVKGGLTPLLKAAHLAEAFCTTLEIHHGGNSHNNVAQLQLMMALANSLWFEVLLPDGAQKYGLLQDIELAPDGTVSIAPFEAPGIGAAIDFEMVRAKSITVLR